MSKFNTLVARFARDERGATMVEYSILLAIITAATVVTIGLVGDKVSLAWTTLNAAWVP
jgi:pilus assembly protein Flp/PilA